MTLRSRAILVLAGVALVAGALAYLRDPPWLERLTFGMREWREEDGVRFRWTWGHATWFVRSDAKEMTLLLRCVFPSDSDRPVTVTVSADDRPITIVTLDDPSRWTRAVVLLPRRATDRRVRRIDLRVSRTVGEGNYGVQLNYPGSGSH